MSEILDNGTLAYRVRRIILEQAKRAGVGHIGSALSIADIVALLYGGALSLDAPRLEDRDRFILSKGHAALALYAALNATGRMSDEMLNTYCGDGTPLGAHPEYVVEGIEFSTGSLGHGLSIGAGCAVAARLLRSDHRVFVLVSDAECNEGSLWEAVMFAAQRRLGNLVAIVDVNGRQAFGATADVLDLSPLSQRWASFGWDAHDLDGHDLEALASTIEGLDPSGPPHVLLAHTTFGNGVSFMEDQLKWHYWPMSDDEYKQALAEVDAAAHSVGETR